MSCHNGHCCTRRPPTSAASPSCVYAGTGRARAGSGAGCGRQAGTSPAPAAAGTCRAGARSPSSLQNEDEERKEEGVWVLSLVWQLAFFSSSSSSSSSSHQGHCLLFFLSFFLSFFLLLLFFLFLLLSFAFSSLQPLLDDSDESTTAWPAHAAAPPCPRGCRASWTRSRPPQPRCVHGQPTPRPQIKNKLKMKRKKKQRKGREAEKAHTEHDRQKGPRGLLAEAFVLCRTTVLQSSRNPPACSFVELQWVESSLGPVAHGCGRDEG